jgi:hypothetical protein
MLISFLSSLVPILSRNISAEISPFQNDIADIPDATCFIQVLTHHFAERTNARVLADANPDSQASEVTTHDRVDEDLSRIEHIDSILALVGDNGVSLNVAQPGLDWLSMLLTAVMFTVLWVFIVNWLAPGAGLGKWAGLGRSNSQDKAETARSLLIFFTLQDQLLHHTVLLDSLNMAQGLGRGAVYSGWFIGSHSLGFCIACSALWLVMRSHPDLWRRSQPTLVCSAILSFVGSALLSIGIVLIPAEHHTESSWVVILQVLLIAARVITGLGGGLCHFMLRHIFAHVSSPSERLNQMPRLTLTTSFGMGAGPFVASAAHAIRDLVPSAISGQRFELLAAIFPTITIVTLAATRNFPSLESVKDYVPDESGETAPLEKSEVRRRLVVVWCILLFVGGRCFCVSSLSAATTMLLEVEFHWEPSAIGLAVGSCFMFGYLVKLFHDAYKENFTLASRLRLLMAGTLLGAILLLPKCCVLSTKECSWMLLIATCMLFSCKYLSDGLMQGMIYNHALPQGSLLDVNNLSLFIIFLANAVGNFLGPPAARYNVAHGGQTEYATWQIAICLVSIMMMEVAFFFNASTASEKGGSA